MLKNRDSHTINN